MHVSETMNCSILNGPTIRGGKELRRVHDCQLSVSMSLQNLARSIVERDLAGALQSLNFVLLSPMRRDERQGVRGIDEKRNWKN